MGLVILEPSGGGRQEVQTGLLSGRRKALRTGPTSAAFLPPSGLREPLAEVDGALTLLRPLERPRGCSGSASALLSWNILVASTAEGPGPIPEPQEPTQGCPPRRDSGTGRPRR